MAGGVSHVDTFDYKPPLERDDGKMRQFDDARNLARTGTGTEVARHEVAVEVSAARPDRQVGVANCFRRWRERVDDLCFLHGMHTEGVAHGPATLFPAHRLDQPHPALDGLVGQLRPGHGEREPAGFIVLSPVAGQRRPAELRQRVPAGRVSGDGRSAGPALPAKDSQIRNLLNSARSPQAQQAQFDLLQSLNHAQLKTHPRRHRVGSGDRFLRAGIPHAAPRAGRARPVAREHARRSPCTASAKPATDNFGRQCLMARRLAEAGVRYIQVTYADNSNNPAWDQHSNMPKHAEHAAAVDQADRRPARRPQAARPARGHARLVGRRVRPHPVRARERHRPRPQSRTASPSGSPAAA